MKSKQTILSITIVLLVVLLGFLFLSYNQRSKIVATERFMVPAGPAFPSVADNSNKYANPGAAGAGTGSFAASSAAIGQNEQPQQISGYDGAGAGAGFAPANGGAPSPACFPKDRLTADDLLPKDAANSKWAQMNPAGQGDLRDQNFLTAGTHIGINTVGSSMKNPNLQLRSEPPNPQIPVSPWMISTITYSDVNRRPLEIGGDY
jgi:hypothetical protein